MSFLARTSAQWIATAIPRAEVVAPSSVLEFLVESLILYSIIKELHNCTISIIFCNADIIFRSASWSTFLVSSFLVNFARFRLTIGRFSIKIKHNKDILFSYFIISYLILCPKRDNNIFPPCLSPRAAQKVYISLFSID